MRILALTLACLGLTASVARGTTWFGGQLQFPVPARDIGATQLGVGAGATITRMVNAHVGLGADVAYHYWPASPGYQAAFDRYLQTERMEALTGSEWALSALQITGHIKLVAPAGRRCAAWVQAGGGAYHLNFNLDQRRTADTYAWVVGPGLGNFKVSAGGYGAIGLDVHVSPPVALGVDATFHYVRCGEKSTWGYTGINDLQDFSAFTVGMHALFGWR